MLRKFRDRITRPVRSPAWTAGHNYAATLPPVSLPLGGGGEGEINDLEAYFEANTDGPGIWKWRHYFPIYDRHLAKFRGQPINVVEVGIFSGGSLGMWRNYFGPGCHVHGVDIDPACKAYEGDGVTVHIGDQADPAFWDDFKQKISHVDVLIDDGGHEAFQQIATLEAMLPMIAAGGVYFCEDIHTEAHRFHDYLDGLSRPLSAIGANEALPGAIHQHISSVHRYPLVAVIEKPDRPVTLFEAPRRGTQWEPFVGTGREINRGDV